MVGEGRLASKGQGRRNCREGLKVPTSRIRSIFSKKWPKRKWYQLLSREAEGRLSNKAPNAVLAWPENFDARASGAQSLSVSLQRHHRQNFSVM